MEQRNEPTTDGIQVSARLIKVVKEANERGESIIICSDALIMEIAEMLDRLERELAAEKARADAAENAVNDLIHAAATKTGICHACTNITCSRFGKGCGGVNFRWRGAQERGKGTV